MKRTTKVILAERSNEALADLIRWADAEYGRKALVHREFCGRTKTKPSDVSRVMVDRWLHPDASQRTQPLFGAGLVLLAIWRDIKP